MNSTPSPAHAPLCDDGLPPTPLPPAPPPRNKMAVPAADNLVIELDAVASAMLRRVVRQGSSCREAGADPRDLVNAAVTFYLCDDNNCRHGGFSLEDGQGALNRARQDRLALAGKEAVAA